MNTTEKSPHRVVVLALDSAVAFEVGLPARFFATRSLLPGWPTAPEGDLPYAVSLVTVDNQPVQTSAGFLVTPTDSRDVLSTADTVVICGVTDHPVLRTGELSAAEHAALDLVPEHARWLSICTGAFVLAARSLLDGRRATTHWVHADAFRRLFPHLELDPAVLFVDEDQVLTSAGNAAGIDLLLHVLRKDRGAAAAARVARGCVVAPVRSGGQAQFIEHAMVEADDRGLAQLQSWMAAHLDQDLGLDRLAERMSMSVRSLTRRFRAETGQTVGEWLTSARIDRAQDLLETTDAPIDQIAARVGLGSGAALRAQFRAQVGLSPSAYRRTYRGAASA